MSKYNIDINLGDNTSSGKLLRHITPGSTVLEFGCANGRFTHYMKNELGCRVYIVEYDKDAFRDAAAYAEGGLCQDMTAWGWCEEFKDISFDYILFADILEHIMVPEEALSRSKALLKEEGSVLISVPNIAHNDILMSLYANYFQYTRIGLLDRDHIRFFAYNNLCQMCEEAGYAVVHKDGVILMPFETEQNIALSQEQMLRLKEKLAEKPMGSVYQFVFRLQKSEYVKQAGVQPESKLFGDTADYAGSFYFDTGKGYTENEKRTIFGSGAGDSSFAYRLQLSPDVKAVRFDPVEGMYCIIDHLQVNSNAGPIRPQPVNGFEIGDFHIFISTDPQYQLDLKGMAVTWIEVRGRSFHTGDFAFVELFRQVYRRIAEREAGVRLPNETAPEAKICLDVDGKEIAIAVKPQNKGESLSCFTNLDTPVGTLCFHPAGDMCCIVRDIKIMSGIGDLDICETNGVRIGGGYLFPNDDPQIWIHLHGMNPVWLEITASVQTFESRELVEAFKRLEQESVSSSAMEQLVKTNDSLYEDSQSKDALIERLHAENCQKDALMDNNRQEWQDKITNKDLLLEEFEQHRKSLLEELNNLYGIREQNGFYLTENKRLQQMVHDLKQSSSWRITAPMRMAATLIRRLFSPKPGE